MDALNYWKKIILQWIKECDFLEKTVESIEHSDIELFFARVRERLKSNIAAHLDLASFIKEQYPLFEIHVDDENALSSNDYIYVYSLLLHFSCVKISDQFFQGKCQKLNEIAQQNIAIFFEKLLEINCLTKGNIRKAIASIRCPLTFSTGFVCMDSPRRTPKKQEISPTTPGNTMLQEKVKQVQQLKMQLDNEIYEKGLLEIEVKQNQDKVSKLSLEIKKAHQEIQDLKNELLLSHSDMETLDKYCEKEHINRKLYKKISQNEMEISKQRDEIELLTDQNIGLREKLNHAERELKMFRYKTEELVENIHELSLEIQEKESIINCLSENKAELEQYFSEMQSASSKLRPEFNTSVENMDISRITQGSSSLNSPENLGCSVVDVQLRETESENIRLREEITTLRQNYHEVYDYMKNLINRYSDTFEKHVCNSPVGQGEANSSENIKALLHNMERLLNEFHDSNTKYEEMKERFESMKEENYPWNRNEVQIASNGVSAMDTEYCENNLDNKIMNNLINRNKTGILETQEHLIQKGCSYKNAYNQMGIDLGTDFNKKEFNGTVLKTEHDREDFDRLAQHLNKCDLLEADSMKEKYRLELKLLETYNTINEMDQEKKRINAELTKIKEDNSNLTIANSNHLETISKNEKQLCDLEMQLHETQISFQEYRTDEKFRLLALLEKQVEKDALITSILAKVDGLKFVLEKYEKGSNKSLVLSNGAEPYYLHHVLTHLKMHLYDVIKQLNLNTVTEYLSKNDLLFILPAMSDGVESELKECINILIQSLQSALLKNEDLEDKNRQFREKDILWQIEKETLENRLNSVSDQIHENCKSLWQLEQSKLSNEIKRLRDQNSSLEKTCEKLNGKHLILNKKLLEESSVVSNLNCYNSLLKEKIIILESAQSAQLTLAEHLEKSDKKSRLQIESLKLTAEQLKSDINEAQEMLTIKTKEMELLREQYTKLNCVNGLKKQIIELQSQVSSLEEALRTANTKYEESAVIIANNLEKLKKIGPLKAQLEKELTLKQKLQDELTNANISLAEMKKQKIYFENTHNTVSVNLEQLAGKLTDANAEIKSLSDEKAQLLESIDQLKKSEYMKDSKIAEYSKMSSELNQQIRELTQETKDMKKIKTDIEEENAISLKLLEEKTNVYKLLESDYQSALKNLQRAEADVDSNKKMLESEMLKVLSLEEQVKKVQEENAKLKEVSEMNSKRIERQALKLGEAQAKSIKLQKEVNCLKSNLDLCQNENNKLNTECTTYKNKLAKCEKTIEALEIKLKTLEKANEQLNADKTVEGDEHANLKAALATLEKTKAGLEEKIRKLSASLNESNLTISRLEKDKVTLDLEIGGLNSLILEKNKLINLKTTELENSEKVIIDLQERNTQLESSNEELKLEDTNIKDRITQLTTQLQATRDECESVKSKAHELWISFEAKERELIDLENKQASTLDRLHEVEFLINEKQASNLLSTDKVESLESELARVTTELSILEEARTQDKVFIQKLNTDISILQAKLQKSRQQCDDNENRWYEEKERLLSELKASNDRIKETRLEFEGKLEKMKAKMKTLYNEEIAKVKSKQEREIAALNTNLSAVKLQNEKYEEHTKKLSKQVFRLNENILEYQKENTFLKTKVKDLESQLCFTSRMSVSHPPQSAISKAFNADFQMEDEEGEFLNTTYLSDLKNVPSLEHQSEICTDELRYRNSLQPPHLKSTYLAQLDNDIEEDDIRGMPNLDDSLSALLNTGHRKKLSGATSYKRPGPPTPSKNAGRLSFGGSNEINREVLKDCFDLGNAAASLKTPAKFKLFSSRLSIGDEHNNYMATFSLSTQRGNVHPSSTPRESKLYNDERHIDDSFMSHTIVLTQSSIHDITNRPRYARVSLNSIENRQYIQLQNALKLNERSQDVSSSDDTDYRKETKTWGRHRDRRRSIYIPNGMFANNGYTHNNRRTIRDTVKKREKSRRFAHFNKNRRLTFNQLTIKDSIKQPLNTTVDASNVLMRNVNTKNSDDGVKNKVKTDCTHNSKSLKLFQQVLNKKVSCTPFEKNKFGIYFSNYNNFGSRTIYGSNIFLNRKLPNINTTFVRRQSLYVQKRAEIITLNLNQTINLRDLIPVWKQMNITLKIFTIFSLFILGFSIMFLLLRVIKSFYNN